MPLSKKKFSASAIAKIAVFTAIAFVLYLSKFNLPVIFPSFLEMQFSDLPALIGGFVMGPVEGCLIIIFKGLLKLPLSSTGFVGELGDIIIGICFVLPASLLFRVFKKNPHLRAGNLFAALSLILSALIHINGRQIKVREKTVLYREKESEIDVFFALLAGVLISMLAAVIVNRFLLVPFYVEFFFKGNFGILLGIVAPLYPNVSIENFYSYYLSLAVVPFNLIRGGLSAAFTFLVYKRLGRFLDKF
ncbi:MAG: ECF transporter S component [Clostridiales bacterium]|nr:ECF transporter S component [Clostridiales bacterium]